MAPPDKDELLNQLSGARMEIDGIVAEWRRRLDVGARVRAYPTLSIGTGAVGGFALGHWWPRRRTGGGSRAGRVGPHPVVTVLRTVLTLGRPILSAYFSSQRSGHAPESPDADLHTPDPSTP